MSINTYRASSALTITLASLATSSGLTVGRASTSLSNATNKDEIQVLAGMITVGTSAVAGQIEVWVFAQRADSTWPDLFTGAYSGTDTGLTVRSRDILFAGARQIAAMTVAAGSNVPYTFSNTEIGQLFGYPPKEWAVFVTHSSGVNLNSTAGNHSIDLSAAYY